MNMIPKQKQVIRTLNKACEQVCDLIETAKIKNDYQEFEAELDNLVKIKEAKAILENLKLKLDTKLSLVKESP